MSTTVAEGEHSERSERGKSITEFTLTTANGDHSIESLGILVIVNG